MSDEAKVVKVTDSGKPAEQPPAARTFVPAVDVIETPDALIVLADVPGVTKDKVDVLFEEDVLTIKGEVEAAGEPGMRLELEEYQAGNFHRSFTVGQGLDVSNVEATVKDGVLRLLISKSAALKPRRIEIREG